MFMLSHTQGFATRVWGRLLGTGATPAGAGVLRREEAGRVNTRVIAHERRLDPEKIARAEQLFVEALRDDSNLEADWLWLATKVVREHERRYCLKRALLINPNSEIARRELAKLPPLEAHILRLTGEQ